MKPAKAQPLPGGRLLCPKVWFEFLTNYLHIDTCTRNGKQLSIELWRGLWPTDAANILYAISRFQDTDRSREALRHFCEVCPPRMLMQVCARLAPETGAPRRGDIVALEARIMERTGPDGQWV
jgi:hypothetical protein